MSGEEDDHERMGWERHAVLCEAQAKRDRLERIATAVLAGQKWATDTSHEWRAQWAIEQSKALIRELDKEGA
jgi:hypothetical protein